MTDIWASLFFVIVMSFFNLILVIIVMSFFNLILDPICVAGIVIHFPLQAQYILGTSQVLAHPPQKMSLTLMWSKKCNMFGKRGNIIVFEHF